MAVGSIETLRCPRCRRGFDTRVYGISSGLGPPAIRCRSCDAVVATDRIEWRDMSLLRRVRYVLLSLVYMVFLGYLGAVSTRGFVHFLDPDHARLELRVSPK